jgi:hypothetical protein
MKTCFQSKGQSILEHGQSVYSYYEDLHNHLFNGAELINEWRLPDWFKENTEFIKAKLLPQNIMRDYLIYHDCGKPLCVTIDETGRQHFPDHAKASEQRWKDCSVDNARNVQIDRLIGMDMDIHLLKADDLEAFSVRPEAISLLIAGLCEIHSNASMFGGIESTSFKIKWKHIDKRGRQLIAKLNDKN